MGGTDGKNVIRMVTFVDSEGFGMVEFSESFVAIWKSAGLAVSGEDEVFDWFRDMAGGR